MPKKQHGPRREITVPAIACPYCNAVKTKAYKTVHADGSGKQQYRRCMVCDQNFIANIIPLPLHG
ncbi:MAG: hypothetical protein QM754_12055 [Tepidisphaeraceae bacterium]